ncbi:NB-ARC domain-containing protein [Nonomuraea jabiensis]|uniref:NB-ARC domain-containing protein n=1 Tax=Nonomuraea jabiensis TaxID=882448 RepID=UPI0034454CA5
MTRRRVFASNTAAGVLVLLGIAIGLPVNVVSDYLPPSVTSARGLWITGLVGTAGLIVALTLLLPRLNARSLGVLFHVSRRNPRWVDRAELERLAEALKRDPEVGAGASTQVTGLVGAGGFGKTSLAVEACHRPEVRRHFRGGILWVTVGRDRGGSEIASLINDVAAAVTGEHPQYGDAEQAGRHLAASLAGRGRVLLVVDDIWSQGQLAPFLPGEATYHLLITTRRPAVVPPAPQGLRVPVEELPPHAAAEFLTHDLPPIQDHLVADLLRLTGGWPLLLSIVTSRLRHERDRGADVNTAVHHALRRLRGAGPTAFDLTSGPDRIDAVRATVEYSLDTLSPSEQDRFLELGVFPEDTEIPMSAVALLWRGTAELPYEETQRVCDRLDDLSLISTRWAEQEDQYVVVHDVVRSYMRTVGQAPVERLRSANRQLIERASALTTSGDGSPVWPALPVGERYLWRNLSYHLREAGLTDELNRLTADVDWLTTRIGTHGLGAAESDLLRATSGIASQTRKVLARYGSLLEPADRPQLLSTLDLVPGLHAAVCSYARRTDTRYLSRRWPLPEERLAVFPGLLVHGQAVVKVAIAPDGSWLAAAGGDTRLFASMAEPQGIVRLWGTEDRRVRASLEGHNGAVTALAIAPDGTWLATGDNGGGFRRLGYFADFDGGTIHVWDASDGHRRAVMGGHAGAVTTLAIAPDGTWLATGDNAAFGFATGGVCLHDLDGTERASLDDHTGCVTALAISPDSGWLVSCDESGTMRLWDPDGTLRADLLGHAAAVTALAIAPDGTWLASGDIRGQVRLWWADGTERAVLPGHEGAVTALAIASDGTWLATADSAGVAHLWEADGIRRATLSGHEGAVTALAIAPDGTWLATGDGGGDAYETSGSFGSEDLLQNWMSDVGRTAVRIWDPADGTQRRRLDGHTDTVTALAVAPGGAWLASGSHDGTVRLWNTSTDDPGPVTALAVAPDGTWIATLDDEGHVTLHNADGTVRPRQPRLPTTVTALATAPAGVLFATTDPAEGVLLHDAHGTRRRTVTGHSAVTALAAALDGTWLATGDDEGLVQVWHEAGVTQMTVSGGHVILAAADEQRLAICDSDGLVRWWTAEHIREVSLARPAARITAVATVPGTTWLATGDEQGNVHLWASDGTHRTTLAENLGSVTGLAASPDGTWIAAITATGLIRLWEPARHQQVCSFRCSGSLSCIAWFPDGSGFCAGGELGLYGFTLGPA